MGANAQTTVQKFVDGAVLTAAQQNTSAATGVPVFATTVTRDAAFGGANKVLAEGQTCYLESTNVVQYFDGAAWATVGEASKVVKMVNTQTGAVATGTTVIPFDDTIPQITEGDQYMTVAITPTNALNVLRIQVTIQLSPSAAGIFMSAALFVDDVANALAASSAYMATGTGTLTLTFTHNVVAGGVSALTFRVRAGGHFTSTTTFNGSAGARLFGGITLSSISITEFTP